jgi:exosortase E/protease (VPEID-CTERM system)
VAVASFPPFLRRLSALAVLYILELIAISIWLDNSALAGTHGLTGIIHHWGAWTLRFIVGFTGLFLTCAILKNNSQLPARTPIRPGLLCLHFIAIALFGLLSHLLYTSGSPTNSLAGAWLASGLTAIALGAFSLVSKASWTLVAKGTGYLWLYVLVAATVACAVGNAARLLWDPAARATLTLVYGMLRPFLSGVFANPAAMTIGTTRFSVEIAKECSGLEGIGLILAFTGVWLLLFRKECRFPNALVLLPAGVVIMFLFNAARIAILVAIGNAGAERIALGGFHSQAGWIAFIVVALGLVVSARHVPWLMAAVPHSSKSTENPTAGYLLPFIAILASGMVSTAASGGFEWFYPLRFFAAITALWYFRRQYSSLEWSFSWFGPATGVVVFILWTALDGSTNPLAETMPTALAVAPESSRDFWIAFRALAAIVTVPVAEELAFRGFLLRRLIATEFESVSLQKFSWTALAISSVLFGLLHGDRWFVGTLAGLLYGVAQVRQGKFADAVVAHATTNAMLAASVLIFGKWHYW